MILSAAVNIWQCFDFHIHTLHKFLTKQTVSNNGKRFYKKKTSGFKFMSERKRY